MSEDDNILIDERLDFVPRKRIPAKMRLFVKLYFEHPEGGAVRVRVPLAKKGAVIKVMESEGWVETDAAGYQSAQRKVASMDTDGD